MKINRVACDLCSGDENRDAYMTLKFYPLMDSKMVGSGKGRGAPRAADTLDLCVKHYDGLSTWVAGVREGTQ